MLSREILIENVSNTARYRLPFFYFSLCFQIEEFDQDGDGKIDLTEFIDLMMGDEFGC